MKKLIVLIVFVQATLSGISQIPSDSITCLPNSKLRLAIKKLEVCKVMQEELELTKANVTVLENRLAGKDMTIAEYEKNEVRFGEKEKRYNAMLDNLNQQIRNEQMISKKLGLKLKFAKINKWVFGGGGLVIGAGILLLKK